MFIRSLSNLSQRIPNFRIACPEIYADFYTSLPCIYRSGDLSKIDSDTADIIVHDLQIECHIDLRSHEEVEKRGYSRFLTKPGILRKHFPILDVTPSFRTLKQPSRIDYIRNYLELLESNKAIIADIINFIAYSACSRFIISCYAGKDRTGIIIMLLMFILDIEEENILNDYTLSGKYLFEHIDYFEANWLKRGITREEYQQRLKPSKKILHEVIAALKHNYGSIHHYIISLGISEETIETIQNKFNSKQKLLNTTNKK